MKDPDILPNRFLSKVDFNREDGCWIWEASTFNSGYGAFWLDGAMRLAHRVSYLILSGPLGDGIELDHKCFVERCVNPEHLRPVTRKQNSEHRRGAQSNSKSGIRGVSWRKNEKRWDVQVKHNGINYHGGHFLDIKEAEQAAIALRARLFTHEGV